MSAERVIGEIERGGIAIVCDDAERENEGFCISPTGEGPPMVGDNAESQGEVTPDNLRYLTNKRTRMGHLLALEGEA